MTTRIYLLFLSQEPDPVREPATAELWVLYFLSQHYDHLGDFARALTLVEEAIEHTPTLIELFLLKGKIFKVRIYLKSFLWFSRVQRTGIQFRN